MTQEISTDLWTGASHAQTGRALQRAIQTALELRAELDWADPIDTAFLTGLGFLLRISEQHLAYDRIKGFKRDVPGFVQQVRDELIELRERIAMPVKDQQITELGISDRVTVGSSFKLCVHLRALRLDARYTQTREVTVPPAEEYEALRAARVWRDEPSDWWAEGRMLVRIR